MLVGGTGMLLMMEVISFSAAISACGKGGQWEQAWGLFHNMRRTCITANVSSINAAILACKQGGHWEQALALLREMQKQDRELASGA